MVQRSTEAQCLRFPPTDCDQQHKLRRTFEAWLLRLLCFGGVVFVVAPLQPSDGKMRPHARPSALKREGSAGNRQRPQGTDKR
jgi:hypothetical protein